MPQTIAHRGYKAKHPENTMCAFTAAVKARADALETDVHLTRDSVAVLSHDRSLKRCFGIDKKIADCEWSELSRIRTLQPPHEPMPRLVDLLLYLAQPDLQHIWVLLDIKTDDSAEKMMKCLAQTIPAVPPDPGRPWNHRIVLGIWAAKYLPLCDQHLPEFPISLIARTTCYARQFLSTSNVSFNMLQKMLIGPTGARFMRDVKSAGRQLFVWTVNEEIFMQWSIEKEVDGVITDEVEKFKRISQEWHEDRTPVSFSAMQLFDILWTRLVIMFYSAWLYHKFPESVQSSKRSEMRRRRKSCAVTQ